MNLTESRAIPFRRAVRYSLATLVAAIVSVGLRTLPRVLLGRATVVERETIREILQFLAGTAPLSTLTTFVYGAAAAYAVISGASSPAAFETLVLPHLGGTFLDYVVPFAIGNLVVLKGVVGLTSDIASMRVSQEIDALESVGLHPAEMVFAPRALALIVAAPALAVFGVYAACFGAWITSWIMVGAGFIDFIGVFSSSITSTSVLIAVTKLAITAGAMALIAGYFGFVGARAEQGFVGRITTSAVTTAVLATTLVNLILSVLTAFFQFG